MSFNGRRWIKNDLEIEVNELQGRILPRKFLPGKKKKQIKKNYTTYYHLYKTLTCKSIPRIIYR